MEVKTNKSKIQTVDWNDPALKRWLETITHINTVYLYRSAFRAYAKYTKLTASQLIDEAIEDFKRDPRERQDIVLKKLTGFYNWLQKDYQKVSRGKGKHKVVGTGTTTRSAVMRVNVIRSFYSTFGVNVKMKGRHKLPRGRVKNKRMIVGAEHVRTLVQHARNLRNRAIILVNFQSGMDASTICTLNYEDIAQIENGEHPLKLDLVRPKTDTEYYTFLGHDAITALKAYIADQKARGTNWTPESPLFTKERRGTKERITTNLIQNMLKEVAQLSGLVSKNNGKDFNILGPHALRESFSSIMLNSGVPKPIVDFWLGHTINGTDEAYMTTQFNKAKEMYAKREHLLSINASTEKEEELRKIKDSISDIIVNSEDLKTEVKDLRERLSSALGYIAILLEEKDIAQRKEAQEDFNKLIDELNKEHPVPKKAK